MFLDDSVGDGQAEAGALSHVFRGEERIEDSRQDIGGNARARCPRW